MLLSQAANNKGAVPLLFANDIKQVFAWCGSFQFLIQVHEFGNFELSPMECRNFM